MRKRIRCFLQPRPFCRPRLRIRAAFISIRPRLTAHPRPLLLLVRGHYGNTKISRILGAAGHQFSPALHAHPTVQPSTRSHLGLALALSFPVRLRTLVAVEDPTYHPRRRLIRALRPAAILCSRQVRLAWELLRRAHPIFQQQERLTPRPIRGARLPPT